MQEGLPVLFEVILSFDDGWTERIKGNPVHIYAPARLTHMTSSSKEQRACTGFVS
jgi:hypothetical protein